jgi:hypothetical protein
VIIENLLTKFISPEKIPKRSINHLAVFINLSKLSTSAFTCLLQNIVLRSNVTSPLVKLFWVGLTFPPFLHAELWRLHFIWWTVVIH